MDRGSAGGAAFVGVGGARGARLAGAQVVRWVAGGGGWDGWRWRWRWRRILYGRG